MNEYIIKRVNGEPNWAEVPTLEVGNIMWLPDVGIRMNQQICYDENGIYVHQRCVEANIRAEYTAPLSRVCEDSCMEFFFSIDEDGTRYVNLEINPNGCMHASLCTHRHNTIRLAPDPVGTFQLRSSRTDDGWEHYYKIPVNFLQLLNPDFHMTSGRIIRANCYKCGDLTVQPHYLTWNFVTTEKPDYHTPKDFGKMILE